MGFLAYISQAIGAKDFDKVRRASGQAMMTVLTVGIIFTLLTTGLSGKVPIWMQVDPGIQEMASRYFLILYSPMLFRSASIVFGTVLRAAGDTKTPMRVGIAVNAINIVLNYVLIYPTRTVSVGSLIIPVFGADWGVIGAAAAHTIANTVESAFYIPGRGMQPAAATLAGNAWRARDETKLRSLARTILPLEVGMMVISGRLLFSSPPSSCGSFPRILRS